MRVILLFTLSLLLLFLQYMCDRGGTERSLPLTTDSYDGTLGTPRVPSHTSQAFSNAKTSLLHRHSSVRIGL